MAWATDIADVQVSTLGQRRRKNALKAWSAVSTRPSRILAPQFPRKCFFAAEFLSRPLRRGKRAPSESAPLPIWQQHCRNAQCAFAEIFLGPIL